MNINNSTQKTMQSTQMDYEISSPPLYPYTIYTTQFLLYMYTLLKPEWKLVVWLWLAGVITHSAAAVSCTGPGATCSGSSPRPWTPPSLLAGDTGDWSLHVRLGASVQVELVLLSPVRLLLAD